MKIIKGVLALIIVIVLVLGGIVAYGLTHVDALAKSIIEKSSTQTLGVRTTLRSADVQLSERSLELEGLKIANPSGFTSDHFLTMEKGGVSVDVSKLLKEKVADIPTLTLSTIDVNLEKPGGKSNYGIILANARGAEASDSSSSKGAQYKYVIRRLEIRSISAHANLLPIAGDAAKVDVLVPEIVMTDVGTAGRPLTTDELITLITKTVLAAIISVGGSQLPTEILDELEAGVAALSSLGDVGAQILDQSGQVIGSLGGILGGVEEGLGSAAKGLQHGADTITEGVKDLLGGGHKSK